VALARLRLSDSLDAALFSSKEHHMIYFFLLLTAIVLFQLGALSVWVSVLSVALICAAAFAVAAVIYTLWTRHKSRATHFITHRKP
jgi:hypothetical protein